MASEKSAYAPPRPRGRAIQLAARAVERTGLLKTVYLARRRWKLWRLSRADEPEEIDGVPVPPPRLRFLTGNHPDLGAFVVGGRNTADAIMRQLSEASRPLTEMDVVLDFGCGCGRVARNWATLDGVQIHGCDYNPDLAEWCRRSLTFMKVRRNQLEPPLPYGNEEFDLAYSISIFTHLPLELQREWIDELRRVLRPGGALLITLHGRHHADEFLTGADLETFGSGKPVVLWESLAGMNGCMSLHPHDWVKESLLTGFDLISFWPYGQGHEVGQDMYLAVKQPGPGGLSSHA